MTAAQKAAAKAAQEADARIATVASLTEGELAALLKARQDVAAAAAAKEAADAEAARAAAEAAEAAAPTGLSAFLSHRSHHFVTWLLQDGASLIFFIIFSHPGVS